MCSDFSLDHLEPDEKLPKPEQHYFAAPVRELAGCASRLELLSSDKGGKIEDGIWDLIEQASVEFLSFDVFDTYLLRNNKPEALRYLELSQLALDRLLEKFPKSKKLKSLTAQDLCQTRIMGMQATYRTRPQVKGCCEGLIGEVIAMQRLMLGFNKAADSVLLAAEIEYEAENLAENPILAKIAHRFRKGGGKVILVSDMYLGSKAIGKIIGKVAAKVLHDHLFSSADMVISKRSGKIFPAIEKKLGVGAGSFLHLGDAWIGDVQKPRDAGWRTLYFPVSDEEKQGRQKALNDFILSMDEKNIETRSWAKL